MKLIFIRHAEPDYTIDSLTEKGWREAKILAERVAEWDVTQFYCSPLGRARDTASFSLQKHHKEATILPWLQEFYYRVKDPEREGERIAWDFMPAYFTGQEILHDKNQWMNSEVMQSGNIATHYEEVCTGFDALLREHGYARQDGYYRVEKANEEVLVFFCHLGVSFAIIGHLLGIAPPVLWQGYFVAPTAVTILGSEERVPGEAAFRIQVMGDASHLTNAGEPISAAGYFTDVFQK